MGKIFSVRFARPVIQYLTVEVEAPNLASAVEAAAKHAETAPNSEWITQEFNNVEYSYHFHSALDLQHVYETSNTPHRDIKRFQSTQCNDQDIKYLLLKADTVTGAGQLLSQPWFEATEQLVQAELCGDWKEPIYYIFENDGIDEPLDFSFEDSHSQSNVIPFPGGPMQDDVYLEAER